MNKALQTREMLAGDEGNETGSFVGGMVKEGPALMSQMARQCQPSGFWQWALAARSKVTAELACTGS